MLHIFDKFVISSQNKPTCLHLLKKNKKIYLLDWNIYPSRRNFELPWLDDRSRCRIEVPKKHTPHRTCRKWIPRGADSAEMSLHGQMRKRCIHDAPLSLDESLRLPGASTRRHRPAGIPQNTVKAVPLGVPEETVSFVLLTLLTGRLNAWRHDIKAPMWAAVGLCSKTKRTGMYVLSDMSGIYYVGAFPPQNEFMSQNKLGLILGLCHIERNFFFHILAEKKSPQWRYMAAKFLCWPLQSSPPPPLKSMLCLDLSCMDRF